MHDLRNAWTLAAWANEPLPGAQLARRLLASSGAVVRLATGQTVVAALAAAGVQVPVSCEQGVCGACPTRVLGGTPERRDLFLTDEAHALGNSFTPCCSRALLPQLVPDL